MHVCLRYTCIRICMFLYVKVHVHMIVCVCVCAHRLKVDDVSHVPQLFFTSHSKAESPTSSHNLLIQIVS